MSAKRRARTSASGTGTGHLKVLADLSCQVFVNVVVAGNRGNLLRWTIDVDRVAAPFAQELASVLLQVPKEIPTLHAMTLIGSRISSLAAPLSRANIRFASTTRATASRRFARASSSVAPCVLAPGTS